jgi:hypothetical protein
MRVILTAVGLLTFGFPAVARAQQQPAVPEIGEEKLTAFAKAFTKISVIRDEINNELGRTHDAQGKSQIREKLNQRIAATLQEHGLTAQEFQRLTFIISVDAKQREVFDKIVAGLGGTGGS